MIDVSVITQQIVEWLADDKELDGIRISRGEPVNIDAGQAVNGWIGVYRRRVEYEPRNLGVPPDNYRGELTIMLIVQRTSLESGAACEDELEESVRHVIRRVVQIPRTYIDTFLSASVDYSYLETDRTTMFFQGALVTLVAAVSNDVSS